MDERDYTLKAAEDRKMGSCNDAFREGIAFVAESLGGWSEEAVH